MMIALVQKRGLSIRRGLLLSYMCACNRLPFLKHSTVAVTKLLGSHFFLLAMGRHPHEIVCSSSLQIQIQQISSSGGRDPKQIWNSTASLLAIGHHPHVGAISPASGTPPHGALSVK